MFTFNYFKINFDNFIKTLISSIQVSWDKNFIKRIFFIY